VPQGARVVAAAWDAALATIAAPDMRALVEAERSLAMTDREVYLAALSLAIDKACAGLVRADYANVSAIPELDCFFAEPITRDHCAHCALSQPHAAAPHPPVTWSDVARQYGVEVAAPPAAAPTVAPVAVTVPAALPVARPLADALPTDEDELLARVLEMHAQLAAHGIDAPPLPEHHRARAAQLLSASQADASKAGRTQ
jgi:hypothetical protein